MAAVRGRAQCVGMSSSRHLLGPHAGQPGKDGRAAVLPASDSPPICETEELNFITAWADLRNIITLINTCSHRTDRSGFLSEDYQVRKYYY